MATTIRNEFDRGVQRKRIVHFSDATKLVRSEIEAARDDLAEAANRILNKKYKYATITAYYAMFHCARALIYSKSYREKSHYFLLVALRALFVETQQLDEEIVSSFHDAMSLREDADYHSEFSREGAEIAVDSAVRFIKKTEKILKVMKPKAR